MGKAAGVRNTNRHSSSTFLTSYPKKHPAFTIQKEYCVIVIESEKIQIIMIIIL